MKAFTSTQSTTSVKVAMLEPRGASPEPEPISEELASQIDRGLTARENTAEVEADRLLTASEVESRVYAYFGCSPESHLSKPEQVA